MRKVAVVEIKNDIGIIFNRKLKLNTIIMFVTMNGTTVLSDLSILIFDQEA